MHNLYAFCVVLIKNPIMHAKNTVHLASWEKLKDLCDLTTFPIILCGSTMLKWWESNKITWTTLWHSNYNLQLISRDLSWDSYVGGIKRHTSLSVGFILIYPSLVSTGQREIADHLAPLHGHPRDSVLWDPAAPWSARICQEPRLIAPTGATAASKKGQGIVSMMDFHI